MYYASLTLHSFFALATLVLAGCPQGSFHPITDDYSPTFGETSSSSSTSGTPTTAGPPECGDGLVEEGEACDDGPGNTKSSWELDRTCSAAFDCLGYADYCGDGKTNGPEVCDDGAGNSDEDTGQPHCNAKCSAVVVEKCGDGTCQDDEDVNRCPQDCAAVCGDGKVQPGEQCDESTDTATCDDDCTNPSCGDGHANAAANEACDDGNQNDADVCRNDCSAATCGDGVVQVGVEACDDGNQTDDDACSNDCVVARRVFVTAGLYTASMIMGVSGADGLCVGAGADLVSPGNTWLAWLSDDTSSPSNRIPAADKSFTGWYLLPDGTPVAEGWSGLTSGTLKNPINITEANMAPADPLAAWTNTKADGTSGGASDCTNWTKSDVTTSGYGDLTMTSAAWSQEATTACVTVLHIYCIEVRS